MGWHLTQRGSGISQACPSKKNVHSRYSTLDPQSGQVFAAQGVLAAFRNSMNALETSFSLIGPSLPDSLWRVTSTVAFWRVEDCAILIRLGTLVRLRTNEQNLFRTIVQS